MSNELNTNEHLNLIGDNNFHFEIRELPRVSLFAQNFSVPGINLGRAARATSNVDYHVPGDKIEYEDLVVTFLVDEYMHNFIEIFNWMVALGYPEKTNQFKKLNEHYTPYTETSDIVMTATTNKFNPHTRIHFVDCFPTDLNPIDFSNAEDTVNPILSTVMFEYSYYYFEPIGDNKAYHDEKYGKEDNFGNSET